VQAVSDLLTEHFPQQTGMVDVDELPNQPRIF